MADITVNREQLAIVLDRIAEHSTEATIRADIQLVAKQLRGSGFIIVNLPPSAAETADEACVPLALACGHTAHVLQEAAHVPVVICAECGRAEKVMRDG